MLVLVLPRRQFYGSNKWRWSIRWTILNHRAQFKVILYQNFEMLDARIASALNMIIQNSYFMKKVNLAKQQAQEERKTDRSHDLRLSVAVLAQAISCSNVRMIFLRHELFWFCLVQVFSTQFCWFPPSFLVIARPVAGADHANVPNSPLQDLSSNFGSLDGSLPDFERVGARPTHSMEERFEAILARRLSQSEVHFGALASIPMLVQGFTSFENSILSLTQSMATITNIVSSVEQVVGGLQPQGPLAQGHLKKAGIQDADSIPSHVQMIRKLEVPFFHCCFANNAIQAWLKKHLWHLFQPICQSGFVEQVEHLLGSYLAREPSANNSWQHRDDGLPYSTVPRFWFVNLSHQKTEKSEDVLHFSGRCWPRNFKNSSLALDVRAQVLSVFDRRKGFGKPGASLPGTRVCTFRLEPTMALVEYQRASWSYCLLSTLKGTQTYLLHTVGQRTISFVSKKPMGKTSSCRLFTCYILNSECLVHLHQTT